MKHPERELPKPFEWQDHNDLRYDQQQQQIDNLTRKVNLLMELTTYLMLESTNAKKEILLEKSPSANKATHADNVRSADSKPL